MIRAAALFWLLVVLSGMTAAVMLSGNYQVWTLERVLRAAMQERAA